MFIFIYTREENRVFAFFRRRPRSQKTQDISKHPTEGDIVLVYGDTPRSTWTLGRVEGLYKGNDGQERSGRVRTQARDITRALC